MTSWYISSREFVFVNVNEEEVIRSTMKSQLTFKLILRKLLPIIKVEKRRLEGISNRFVVRVMITLWAVKVARRAMMSVSHVIYQSSS